VPRQSSASLCVQRRDEKEVEEAEEHRRN